MHPAGVLQQQQEFVLRLRADLVRLRVHPTHRAEEMQSLVDQMAAEVAKQTATGRRRLGLRRPALERRLEPAHLAQTAGVQESTDGQQVGVPASVLVRTDQHTFALGQLDRVPGGLSV